MKFWEVARKNDFAQFFVKIQTSKSGKNTKKQWEINYEVFCLLERVVLMIFATRVLIRENCILSLTMYDDHDHHFSASGSKIAEI